MIVFPPAENADSDGFLCWGGNLEPSTLLSAYSQGIFPWSGENEPITWWSLDPRLLLFLNDFEISKRSERKIKNSCFNITVNKRFKEVMSGCASPRKGCGQTWLHATLQESLLQLHLNGWAHSVEVWLNHELVGGLYGLAIGRVFCGDSMFHYVPEASRAALCHLVTILKDSGFLFIDCQQVSSHMLAMGAKVVPRKSFLELMRTNRIFKTEFK